MQYQRDLGEYLRKSGVRDDTALPLGQFVQPVSIVADDSKQTQQILPAIGYAGQQIPGAGGILYTAMRMWGPAGFVLESMIWSGGVWLVSDDDGAILATWVKVGSLKVKNWGDRSVSPQVLCDYGSVTAAGSWGSYMATSPWQNVNWWVPAGVSAFFIAQGNGVFTGSVQWREPR